jgi:hypothetical protein
MIFNKWSINMKKVFFVSLVVLNSLNAGWLDFFRPKKRNITQLIVKENLLRKQIERQHELENISQALQRQIDACYQNNANRRPYCYIPEYENILEKVTQEINKFVSSSADQGQSFFYE